MLALFITVNNCLADYDSYSKGLGSKNLSVKKTAIIVPGNTGRKEAVKGLKRLSRKPVIRT